MSEVSLSDDLARALDGDDAAFGRLVGPLQPELRAHCYRMLGSIHDADDALQDALVRAWRGLSRFERRSSLRTWLYTVTTRVCLDALANRGRRLLPVDLGPSADHPVPDDVAAIDVPWLTPYPAPDGQYEQREAVELAYVAACQHLSGNQRAALLLFDVLGFSAAEIAATMDTSVASVNSALQRARAQLPLPSVRSPDDAELRRTVESFAGALERGDAEALVALLTEDVTWSMPPLPQWYAGAEAVRAFALAVPMARCGSWRHRVTWANGGPAVASYLAATDPDGPYLPWSVNVFDFADDRIAGITSFLGEGYFRGFGLPPKA
ncbi:sigma-70 family RNA polymerase sigma factor [Cryptosporangium sp. NPDC048952]|uniref:sigma-70 family RNA polymerase sigma factor n=1 Tax=Cryptosporangium sp. NPDC048952 TaxID=3363961 RepID=UPI00371E6320